MAYLAGFFALLLVVAALWGRRVRPAPDHFVVDREGI